VRMKKARASSTASLSQCSLVTPILSLAGMVLLFSTIAPATKYVFQMSHLDPNVLTCARVGIGFLCLLPTTLLCDARGLASLQWTSLIRLTGLGWLGVVSYAIAAWGLQYTTVSHYIVIYSLIPTFTTFFAVCFGRQTIRGVTLIGITCASLGCIIAISDASRPSNWTLTFGDGCALLYTVMMAAHMACSGGIAKQFGLFTANTVMFGTSLLILFPTAWASYTTIEPISFSIVGVVIYIGLATVGAFLLRYRTLRTLPPATVAAYHNLIPICTILLAHLALDEPLDARLVLGGMTILAGIELVRRGPDLTAGWTRWLLLVKQGTSLLR
jgi:drug/metabolite transporter (DMT)-like permease